MAKCVKRDWMCFLFGAGFSLVVVGFVYMTKTVSTIQIRFKPAILKTTKNNTIHVLPTSKQNTTKYLNIFNASMESSDVRASVSTHQCIPYNTRGGKASICLHPRHTDVHVSGSFLRSGRWESGFVELVANTLTGHPGMSFLDIGCNIGTFTVYMAKMGRRVVGVDANKVNLLLLSRSLSIGKLHQNVTLILNALSDIYEYVTLQKVANNQGGRFVIPSREGYSETVHTIMLDELAFMFTGQSIFIKMDIEGSEWKTLNGGKEFFRKVDVKFVLMEFVLHKNKASGKQICDFFTKYGFRAYRGPGRTGALNIAQYRSWPNDVLWIKEKTIQ